MSPSRTLPLALLTALAAALLFSVTPATRQSGLRDALTFHAPFDSTADASHAAGDARIYAAPTLKGRADAVPGLPEGGLVRLDAGAGKFGGALRFTARKSPVVFFKGARNMPYAGANWSGTVSFWLNTDPAGELEEGFCDPVQITPRAWNDAAFFVEFEKRKGTVPFRLGVYADMHVWNPSKRPVAEIPTAERPLLTVADPPFSRGRWTHVVFTFERFNTGRADGVARLFLDGIPQGTLGPREQTFTWDVDQTIVALGLNYIGALDDLALFNRALSDEEVRRVHALASGIAGLAR